MNRLKDMFNAFVGDVSLRYGGQSTLKLKSRQERSREQVAFPWLNSFLFGRMNEHTPIKHNYTNNNQHNSNTYGKLFKEITGEPNSKQRLTQIRNKFSDKLSAGYINDHDKLLSLESVSESSLGVATADRTEIKYLKLNTFRGNVISIAIKGGLSTI